MTHEQWLNDLRERYSRAMKRGDTKTAEGIAQIARKPPVIVPDISDIGYVQVGVIIIPFWKLFFRSGKFNLHGISTFGNFAIVITTLTITLTKNSKNERSASKNRGKARKISLVI